MNKKILLIYTGGTIGMIQNNDNRLTTFNFEKLLNAIPDLNSDSVYLNHISIKNPIDSSNMQPNVWSEIARIIAKNYIDYNGFVILHGTDTMAFTASAISFMLENLNKPVVFTGSQIPIGIRRTDAKENLIGSVEIAAEGKVNEVCIFFENQLYRGNRTVKISTENFEAFESPNYPLLAELGVNIKYNKLVEKNQKELKIHTNISNDVAVLKLFPGISLETIEAVINSARGIVIESFGAGNAPNNPELTQILSKANNEGKILINISQCLIGSAVEGKYETSELFVKAGVICGGNLTTEAATTKLMFLLGQKINENEIKKLLQKSIRGEMCEKTF